MYNALSHITAIHSNGTVHRMSQRSTDTSLTGLGFSDTISDCPLSPG